MSLNLPTSAQEVDARSKADVKRELADSNPFLKNSWLGAIVTASASRIFDFYIQLKEAIKQSSPYTATGDFLYRWAAIWGKQLLPASKSSGLVVATGTIGSTIPSGSVLSIDSGGTYSTTASATISAKTATALSIVRSGTTATITTTSEHGLANGISVTVSGATNSEYNITAVIIVTGLSEFQYEIIGSPADEPTTSAIASFATASVPISSDLFGLDTSLDAGTVLKLQSPLAGVDDSLTVDFGAIGGGSDAETDRALRERMLDRIQNPVALFNVAAIKEKAKEIAGVTRVFVYEATPAAGQVTIYFMRDNDVNPIPTGSEVTAVKNKILEIKPATNEDANIIVNSPVGVVVNFTFSDLSPNTSTMKTAIDFNLRQFFDENTSVGVNVDQDAYRAAIYNTVDTVTGQTVNTFTLSAPPGDVTIAAGEIGILGTTSYP